MWPGSLIPATARTREAIAAANALSAESKAAPVVITNWHMSMCLEERGVLVPARHIGGEVMG